MLQSLIRLRNNKFICCFPAIPKRFCSVELILDESDEESRREVRRYREPRTFKKNFVENLFLGLFDPNILEYPQIRTIEEVDYLKKHKEGTYNLVLNNIDYNEIETTGKISENTLALLRDNEVLGMKIKLEKQGLGYFESESSYIQESLSLSPSLSKAVAEFENFGYQIINLFGNERQKREYLPRFLSGDCIACLAHLENTPWIALESLPLSTTAVKLSDNSYAISGRKTLVYNPNSAEIIIVSAKTNGQTDENDKNSYTLFMIDKNCKGVTVLEPLDKIGLRGTEICEVVFDNVIVSENKIIGPVNEGNCIIKQLLSQGKLCNGAQCIGLMKKMINDVITYSIRKNHFNKSLHKFNYIQGKIGELVTTLYAAESMMYLMTGRIDSAGELNVMLESLIVKIFTSEALNFVVKSYIQFVGKEEKDTEFMERLLRDYYFFSAFDDPNHYLKMVLATIGVKYTVNQMESGTEKDFKPKSSFMLKWRKGNLHKKLPDILKGYLHLALEKECEILEYCVKTLNYETEDLIRKYGNMALDRTHDLLQLVDLLIAIYKLTAVLGRSSRSYCIGHRYSDTEILIARCVGLNCLQKCLAVSHSLLQSSRNISDYCAIGKSALDSSEFFIHPAAPLRIKVSQ